MRWSIGRRTFGDAPPRVVGGTIPDSVHYWISYVVDGFISHFCSCIACI